ncbi:hypothetical protein AAFA46_03860 [Oscillospiraceae bacterium WX1]
MRSLMKAIDKFCLTHRRFGIPRLMMTVIIGTAAVLFIAMLDTTHTFTGLLTFDPYLILRGQIWRLVSWVFIPVGDSILFTAIMLYFYYFIGSTLEREWGTPKFNIYYLIGILINIVYGFVVWALTGAGAVFYTNLLSASYLNLSMFFAFAVLYPEQQVLLFFIIPIKIKWLAIVDAAYFALMMLLSLVQADFVGAFLPVVAVLNFLLFCYSDLHRLFGPIRARTSYQTISFKKAAKKIQREESSRPYRHKCAVCGKTDAEFPNLEFRYCSRCNGYHCFCADHINSHVHFQ